MPELTDNQIADLRALQHRCAALGAELVIIGAIAYQIHFPAESRHTGDIDFAVALDLDEFAELERRLLADGWVRFANREHRWRSAQATILDLIPAGPKLREAKQITWPISQFKMSLVGFDHVFATAQPVLLALCADDDAQIVYTFLDAMNEVNPAWMAFVRARGVGDHVEEDARAQIDTFRQGFDRNV